jgi:tripartite-type tricarboxylate transporter receptor subunit TctC
VPTLQESGLPGFEYATWYAMLAPAHTHPTLINSIMSSTAKALKEPGLAKRLESRGLEAHASTPGEFDRFLKAEIERWHNVVRAASISVE